MGIVIAKYITVTTDPETSIHRGKGHNMFIVRFKHELADEYNKPFLEPRTIYSIS